MDAVILLSSRFYKVSLVLFFKYFYMETTKVKLNALFIALLPLLGSPVIHAETTAAPVLENRAAQGDITTPGGARSNCRAAGFVNQQTRKKYYFADWRRDGRL